MIGEHSSKQYDNELEAIRSKVLLMGGIVETQVLDAMTCFRIGNPERADRVMREDDVVNQLEVSLDDACSHLIVRRQPAANDLRTIMATIIVMTNSLPRVKLRLLVRKPGRALWVMVKAQASTSAMHLPAARYSRPILTARPALTA